MSDPVASHPAPLQSPLLEIDDLGFAWPGQSELLDIPHFALEVGERVFLKGPSGSGKTTLLGLLGGVQKAGRGRVRLLGRDLGDLSAAARDRYRVDHSGYIFQQFNLLPFLAVRENVEMPCRFSSVRAQRARQRHGSVEQAATLLLERLGLDPDLHQRRADSLSIGQQQRVAAARALIGQPELVIADEPTSSLDADNREAFLALLFEECRDAGASLLFVSHDQSLAGLFDRSLDLHQLNRAQRPLQV
ncbi:ABC transporter ATP-binding protein [Pseudomonas mangrovi]|uniref:Methionine ABC transporter ATP-binding protein n=1 Tax=Pseudomonas mangrovi TaxID=2161748 RepID=A0A2T5P8V7_9PSED|nr:ABC transporter ATP-binding protein [Pseudomonas mangrovi]PTU74151.1 methionine ABC transporter ATP-binding protein [Pseudomonas mangrovi]